MAEATLTATQAIESGKVDGFDWRDFESKWKWCDPDGNLIIHLTDDIPRPKFALFQNVYYKGRKGKITGMDYVSTFRAIKEKIRPGWTYTVSFCCGTYAEFPTAEEVLKAPPTEYYVRKHNLEPCWEDWRDV